MNEDLQYALTEIFNFKTLLQDVVVVAMNPPEEVLDKVFKIYQDFVEMVETFSEFNLMDIQELLNSEFRKFSEKPFFPIIGGLFLNALLNKLFETFIRIDLDLETLCIDVMGDAENATDAGAGGESHKVNEVGFSLDFIGYLLPAGKVLVLKGAVGDYCGALMSNNSIIILNGMHGKHFEIESADSAQTFVR